MTDPITLDWTLMDRLLQYVIIPALAWMWALHRQAAQQDREILRIVTMLEEREKHRITEREETAKLRESDKREMTEAIRDLKATISELRADIVRAASHKG